MSAKISNTDIPVFYDRILQVFEGWQGSGEDFAKDVLHKQLLLEEGYTKSVEDIFLNRAIELHHTNVVEFVSEHALGIGTNNFDEHTWAEMEDVWSRHETRAPISVYCRLGMKVDYEMIQRIHLAPVCSFQLYPGPVYGNAPPDTCVSDQIDSLTYAFDNVDTTRLRQLVWRSWYPSTYQRELDLFVRLIEQSPVVESVDVGITSKSVDCGTSGDGVHSILTALNDTGKQIRLLMIRGTYVKGLCKLFTELVDRSSGDKSPMSIGHESLCDSRQILEDSLTTTTSTFVEMVYNRPVCKCDVVVDPLFLDQWLDPEKYVVDTSTDAHHLGTHGGSLVYFRITDDSNNKKDIPLDVLRLLALEDL